MPEPGDDELQATPRAERADRAEAIATLVALVWVSAWRSSSPSSAATSRSSGFLAIGPFIAAPFARPSRVAFVGFLAAFFALVISTPPHSYGELNHTLRVLTQLAATGVGHVDLLPPRAAQRAAVDGPHRDSQRAPAAGGRGDGAAHADHGPGADDGGRPRAGGRRRVRRPARRAARRRGHLRPPRRARAACTRCVASATTPTSPSTACCRRSSRTDPCSGRTSRSSPSRSTTCAGSVRTSRPLGDEPLPRLGRRPPGRVRPHHRRRRRALERDREISEPDRVFLFTITGTAAQAVERARLTLTEFVNLERTQHLHQLSSALAAATTPGDVAHAAIAGARRALGAQSAVVRIPAAGERSLSCLASSGHPALLSRAMVPVDGSHAGVRVHLGPHRGHHSRRRDASGRRHRRRSDRPACVGAAARARDDRHRTTGRQQSGRSACCPWPSWHSPSRASPIFGSSPRWPG